MTLLKKKKINDYLHRSYSFCGKKNNEINDKFTRINNKTLSETVAPHILTFSDLSKM